MKVQHAHECGLYVIAIMSTSSAIRVKSFQTEYGFNEDSKLQIELVKIVPSSL